MLNCPIFSSLHTLVLNKFPEQFSFGNSRNLQRLNVGCRIRSISENILSNLSELHLNGVMTANREKKNLKKLFVGKHFQKIVKFQEWLGHLETLKNLVDLTIFRPLGMVVKSLPPIPISGLKALRLGGFRSVDLTGLLELRHFEVHEAECDQIKGKNDIYPRLTSLSGTGSVFQHDDMRNYPNLQSFSWRKIFPRQEISFPQYENIPNLTLTTEISTTLKDFPHWGASLKSSGLEMTTRQTRGIPVNRYFENLSLFRYHGPDISMFSNVQKLHLFGCMEVTSIFPARNIP
jgi:hypothetical protein